MKIIVNRDLDALSLSARSAERLRKNLNLHDSYTDPCQRLFNAIEPRSYVRPHRHADPPKPETFLVVRGEFVLVIFDDHGECVDLIQLRAGGDRVAVDLPPGVWHMVIALQPGTIFFETKPGPYLPVTDKDFAPWAPEEGSPEASIYLDGLVKRVCESISPGGSCA
ncbi:MAG: cupin fold metalloprotein, WbuC family [Desulfuromonas sp.]|nr:MAG: cupin fold metalloprotein, WbuC family [Desulfuromonas sp.]